MSVDRIISVESGGNPNARNPRSTATGVGQFIDATWLSMMQKYRPDLIQNMSRGQILAMRTDPQLSRDMTANYANENKGFLANAGLPVTDGTAYLAHFAGPQGAMKVLQADPAAPVGSILGDAVVRANPFLAKMTAGELATWADKKMGGATAMQPPAQQSQPAPPMGILPQQQQAAGILQPQPPAQQSGGILAPSQAASFNAPEQGAPYAPEQEPPPPRMMPVQAFRPKTMKLAQAPRGAFSLGR